MERSDSILSDEIDKKLEELEMLKTKMLTANISIYYNANEKFILLDSNLKLEQDENNDFLSKCVTKNILSEYIDSKTLFVINFSFNEYIIFFIFNNISEVENENYSPNTMYDIIIFNSLNNEYEFVPIEFTPIKPSEFFINNKEITFNVNLLDLIDVFDKVNRENEVENTNPIDFIECLETGIKKLLNKAID
jgi:hypothetical protein